MNKPISIPGVFICLGLLAADANAIDNIRFDGFLTVGLSKITSDTGTLLQSPIDLQSQDGTVSDRIGYSESTRIGLQLSANVSPEIDVTAQLVGRGQDDNFNTFFDWGYLTYNAGESVAIRAGKIRFPTFLISDYFEVGYAYPWIRPPQEVYSSNPISTITGIDMLYRLSAGDIDFLFQPYFGTSRGGETLIPQEVIPPQAAGSVQTTDFDANNFVGLTMNIGSNALNFRLGYLETKVSAAAFGVENEKATFGSAGVTVDWQNIILYSEYFEREIEGAANVAFPNQKGWYTTIGYRINKFMPHVTVASLEDNDNPEIPPIPPSPEFPQGILRSGTPLEQESVTLGMRYEMAPDAALKVELQRSTPAEGTRGLYNAVPQQEDIDLFRIAIDIVF